MSRKVLGLSYIFLYTLVNGRSWMNSMTDVVSFVHVNGLLSRFRFSDQALENGKVAFVYLPYIYLGLL